MQSFAAAKEAQAAAERGHDAAELRAAEGAAALEARATSHGEQAASLREQLAQLEAGSTNAQKENVLLHHQLQTLA
eukprot:scaffold130798_cov27-Phaeocystis_antarctica.AAC.1